MAQPPRQLSGVTEPASAGDAELADRSWPKTLISYAQNFEDVLLHRVFANVAQGFYVDIGAYNPTAGSVTKIFYDRGWSGINIEPGSIFDTLKHDRPRDINLNIAILDRSGMADFVENTRDPGMSRIESPADPQPRPEGVRVRSVRCEPLDRVLAEHAAGRLINFMKIDVEGVEELIIRSTDWRQIRPQVLLVEAVAPWTNTLVSQGWEPVLLSAGYTRAYFDGINLFFVADEHAELLRHFDRPVNVLDWFEKYDPFKDRAVGSIAELNSLSLGLASRLDLLSPHVRGVPDGAPAHVEPTTARLVRELDAALTLVSRFDGAAQQFSQLLQKRHDVMVFGLRSTSAGEQAHPPRLDPDRLLSELDGAIAAAIRYERIVALRLDPDAPRSLRLALPVARAFRAMADLVRRRSEAPVPAPPPNRENGASAELSSPQGTVGNAFHRAGRFIVLPVAERIRSFLLAPLLPVVDKTEATRREIEAVRHVLEAIRAEGQLSPELVQRIEALLLTMAARTSRK